MKLSKIKINNFKNIEQLELIINSQSFEMHRPNGFGKSSIADAIFWVMTGKLYSGSSDISTIKPKSDTSKLVSVELLFDDGTSIMKDYQEDWVRTRGTTETTLKGHTTNCYINGVKEPVTKFDEKLRELFEIKFNGKWPGNIFQLLIDPLYFGAKEEWQERRKLVIDLVGDVTDSDVFAKQPSLKPLEKYLAQNKGKFENVKKSLASSLKQVNEQHDKLKAQIEILSQTQTVSKADFEKATNENNAIDEQIQNLHNKKYQSEKDLIQERENKLAELKLKYSESKQKDLLAHTKASNAQNEELKAILGKRQDLEAQGNEIIIQKREIESSVRKIYDNENTNNSKIKYLEGRRQALLTEWHQVNDTKFATHEHDHLNCPNCGHDLNANLIKKNEEKFNLNKAEKLKTITSEGKGIATEIESLKKENEKVLEKVADAAVEITALDAKIEPINQQIQILVAKYNEINKTIPEFKDSPETLEIKNQLSQLQAQPINSGEDNITFEINALQNKKKLHQRVIDTYNAEQMNVKRAKSLEADLNYIIGNIAEYESLLALLGEFIKVKLAILNDRVEAVFGDIKFQLVESNIKEGSWNEVCYVLDGDVPYHLTNSASKIRIGIRVCEAIKKHLTVNNLFYLIDNAEQITDRDFSKLSDSQTISFVANNHSISESEMNTLF